MKISTEKKNEIYRVIEKSLYEKYSPLGDVVDDILNLLGIEVMPLVPASGSRYEHDCPECKFLGIYEDYDLYFCNQNGNSDTVVARWSDDGPDYASGMSFAIEEFDPVEMQRVPFIQALRIARVRAIGQGLVDVV